MYAEFSLNTRIITRVVGEFCTNVHFHKFAFCGRRFQDTTKGKGKGKGKVVPVLSLLTDHHATKVLWGSGGTAPLYDLGTRWR